MELVVFDLDGTLFNKQASFSDYTLETLRRLSEKGIAYTVATGRTLHAAVPFYQGHQFQLPQIYKNGALIWDPTQSKFTHSKYLTKSETDSILSVFFNTEVNGEYLTPFVMAISPDNEQRIFYGDITSQDAQKLLDNALERPKAIVLPISQLDYNGITNVSTIGLKSVNEAVLEQLNAVDSLATFCGPDMYDGDHYWMDIHHADASKGGAIELLKAEMGFKKVICFGDSDNDISMFEMADECYAPENASDEIKAMATSTIGHHDQDGIARFLRKRFDLG